MKIEFSRIKNFEDYIKLLTEALVDEQAKERKDAENLISSLSPQLFEHVIACLMFGKSCESYEHWCSEIMAWLYGFGNIALKPKSKKITFKDFERWACDEWVDEKCYSNALDVVMYKEKAYNPIGFTELSNHYKDFISLYKSILKMAASGETTPSNLNKILDGWLNKYNITENKGV